MKVTVDVLARAGRRHLDRVRELLGPLPKAGGQIAWDAPIREALALPTAPPEARERWARCERIWWRLARTKTADIRRAEAYRHWRQQTHRVRIEDLDSAALLGLYRAAQSWDPDAPASWRTWAGQGVRMQIRRHLRDGHPVYAPVLHRVAASDLRRAMAELEHRGLPQQLELACELTGLPIERAREVLQADRMIHLDALVTDDGERDFHELVADEGEDVDGRIDLAADVARLRAALARLPARERLVLERRAEGATLAEIGGLVGVSRQRVRQIERTALRHLAALLGVEEPAGTIAGPDVLDRVVAAIEAHGDLGPTQLAELLGIEYQQAKAATSRLRRQRREAACP